MAPADSSRDLSLSGEESDITSRSQQADTEQLVLRIVGGDQTAESELIELYARGVRLMLLHRTDDPDLTDDLFQQTMQIAILRLRAGALQDPRRLSGYMRQIALNLITMHFRRRKGEFVAYDSQINAIACKDDDPIRTIMRWDRIRLVQRAIQSLQRHRDREILRRYYVDSESKARICDELDLTSANFDAVISRARKRLREMIHKQEKVEDY